MDWNFCHAHNCSVSRGLLSDAKQLSRVTEFPFIVFFLAYSYFISCILRLNINYIITYMQKWLHHSIIKRCLVRFLRRWYRNDLRKWHQQTSKKDGVKILILVTWTLCTWFSNLPRNYWNSRPSCSKLTPEEQFLLFSTLFCYLLS